MTHTKGEWFARQMFSGHWDIAAEDGDGKTIARTETEAHARLIAAAPELLEALEEARNVILLAFGNAAWNDESTDDRDSKDEVLTVLAGMEDAIAKAEGR